MTDSPDLDISVKKPSSAESERDLFTSDTSQGGHDPAAKSQTVELVYDRTEPLLEQERSGMTKTRLEGDDFEPEDLLLEIRNHNSGPLQEFIETVKITSNIF